jgi:hypothetical protein
VDLDTDVDLGTDVDLDTDMDPGTRADACTGAGEDPDAGAGPDPGSRVAAARAALADLLRVRRLAGTALEHRPSIALVDGLSGQLAALTDATGLRRGQALGPPPRSPGYRPGEELDRFVRQRDRRCRFPGCRARPTRCDLDHTIPWPQGPTSVSNLCCLCRHHHRLSHQAPGWRLRGLRDGGLEWTTPGGEVVTTRPPRFGADDDLPSSGDGIPSTGRPRFGADDDPAAPGARFGDEPAGRRAGVPDLPPF